MKTIDSCTTYMIFLCEKYICPDKVIDSEAFDGMYTDWHFLRLKASFALLLLRLEIMFKELVSTIGADGLAPWVTKSSKTMLLTLCSGGVLVFLVTSSHQPAMFHCWRLIQYGYIITSFIQLCLHSNLHIAIMTTLGLIWYRNFFSSTDNFL